MNNKQFIFINDSKMNQLNQNGFPQISVQINQFHNQNTGFNSQNGYHVTPSTQYAFPQIQSLNSNQNNNQALFSNFFDESSFNNNLNQIKLEQNQMNSFVPISRNPTNPANQLFNFIEVFKSNDLFKNNYILSENILLQELGINQDNSNHSHDGKCCNGHSKADCFDSMSASWFSIMNSPYQDQQEVNISRLEDEVFNYTQALMKKATSCIKIQNSVICQLLFQYTQLYQQYQAQNGQKIVSGERFHLNLQEELKKFPKANAVWGEYCHFERTFFKQFDQSQVASLNYASQVISYLKTVVFLKNKLVNLLDQTLLCPFCLHNAQKLHFTYHKTKSNWLKHIRKQCFNRIYPTEKQHNIQTIPCEDKPDLYSLIVKLTCTTNSPKDMYSSNDSHSSNISSSFALEDDLLERFLVMDWIPFTKQICDILHQRLQVKDASVIAKTLSFLVILCSKDVRFLKTFLEHGNNNVSLLDMLSQATGFSKYNNEIRTRANNLKKILSRSQHDSSEEDNDMDSHSSSHGKVRNKISSFVKKVFTSNHEKHVEKTIEKTEKTFEKPRERISRELSPLDNISISSMDIFNGDNSIQDQDLFALNLSWEETQRNDNQFDEKYIVNQLVYDNDIGKFINLYNQLNVQSQRIILELLNSELMYNSNRLGTIIQTIEYLIENNNELAVNFFSRYNQKLSTLNISTKAMNILTFNNNNMDSMDICFESSPLETNLLDFSWEQNDFDNMLEY